MQRLLRDGVVITATGKALPMQASSILLHGDTPGAVEFARKIRASIEDSGGKIVPVSQIMADAGRLGAS